MTQPPSVGNVGQAVLTAPWPFAISTVDAPIYVGLWYRKTFNKYPFVTLR